jgi:dihydropteroate synthase
MSATCAALACGAILMHTRGRPHQWRTQPALQPSEVVPLVLTDLNARADAALAAGIARDSIVLDPGFGFGKIRDENYPLLAHLDQLHTLGFPILAGLSRKSFLTRPRTTPNPGAPSSPQATMGIPSPDAPQPALSSSKGLASDTSDPSDPTTIANTAAILAGAHILRVHDVAPARQTAALADRILAS